MGLWCCVGFWLSLIHWEIFGLEAMKGIKGRMETGLKSSFQSVLSKTKRAVKVTFSVMFSYWDL